MVGSLYGIHGRRDSPTAWLGACMESMGRHEHGRVTVPLHGWDSSAQFLLHAYCRTKHKGAGCLVYLAVQLYAKRRYRVHLLPYRTGNAARNAARFPCM